MLQTLLLPVFKKNPLQRTTVNRSDTIKSEPLISPMWRPDEKSWPLLKRIYFNAQSGYPPASHDLDGFYSDELNRPIQIRTITPEDFSFDRLLEELSTLPVSGGEVHLPPGQFRMEGQIDMRSCTRIVGSPDRTELIFDNSDYAVRIVGSPGEPMRNIGLENLRITHIGEHKFCAAVFVSHAHGAFLKNIEMTAPRGVGFLFSDGVVGTRLTGCSVRQAGLVGFMMVRDVRDTVLDSCVADKCGQSGVFLTDLKLPPAMDPLDFDAQIHYTNEVVGNFAPFSPEDPSPQNTTLNNCSFCSNRKMGITTDGVGHLRVINCIIGKNDCEGITIDNGSWGCVIQNCRIFGNGWRGFQHTNELSVDFVKDMGLMEDGSSKAKLPGLSFDNAAYCRVENNSIQGNWGDGVKFVRAGYAITVTGNIIADNNKGQNDRFHFFGILIAGAPRQHPDQNDFPSCHNRIENNDIWGLHYAGIHLLSGTIGNLIQKNRISGYRVLDIEDHSEDENIVIDNFI